MTRPTLRPFQTQLKASVFQEWNQGARNVVMALATGGGKTVTLASIVEDFGWPGCIIAHRQELLGQLSTTLARYGIRHAIVGTDSIRREISRQHVAILGYSMVDQTAQIRVASVDSLARMDAEPWMAQIMLWVVDEGHHVVLDNKWHRAIGKFKHAHVLGLLPTATPIRADRKGLGRPDIGGSGVADVMVKGPDMRWLIDNRYLCDYRLYCPQSDLEVLGEVGASGDWSTKQLKEAAQRSHIIGDIVQAYLTYTPGMLGATFCTDVETASNTARAYRDAGVAAEVLTGKTDDTMRRAILRRLEEGVTRQIVAVDIISEGFDLPAIECLIMGRPSMSYPLFAQQFGRSLRMFEGKEWAHIIDLVGNVIRHKGPPDKPRVFGLANREGRGTKADDTVPYRRCPECTNAYPADLRACPRCGYVIVPATRSRPDAVQGAVGEMDPELLARLREAEEEVDRNVADIRTAHAQANWSQAVSNAQVRNHTDRQYGQRLLRSAMAIWAGPYRAAGYDDDRLQRTFWHLFGVSVPEAKALGRRDAATLMERIERHVHAV